MKPTGFTLIEVLVALVIFSVIAILGYRGLSAMIAAESHLSTEARRWQQLDRFMVEFDNDFRYAAPRGGRDAGGLPHKPFEAVPAPREPDDGNITLTRFAPADDLAGIGMRRVAYRFEPSTVVLLVWPALDAAPRTRPERYVLIEGVAGASARYLDASGRWIDTWPASNRSDEPLPRAIELTLNLEGIGAITRVFAR